MYFNSYSFLGNIGPSSKTKSRILDRTSHGYSNFKSKSRATVLDRSNKFSDKFSIVLFILIFIIDYKQNKNSKIHIIFGRGDRTWTCGFHVPNVALYQAELHLVNSGTDNRTWTCKNLRLHGPEPCASTNSAISANLYIITLYHTIKIKL